MLLLAALILLLDSVDVTAEALPFAERVAGIGIGKDIPRNFPLLATPTPQVKTVLYPGHSFPCSQHAPQYGLFLSHIDPRFRHDAQSSPAPLVEAFLLLFFVASVVGGSGLCALAEDPDMMEERW